MGNGKLTIVALLGILAGAVLGWLALSLHEYLDARLAPREEPPPEQAPPPAQPKSPPAIPVEPPPPINPDVFVSPPGETMVTAEEMFRGGLRKDFGSVPQGTQLFHSFAITNICAEPVEIVRLRKGCGCITASAGKTTLQPGESTTIDVRLDTGRITGPKTENMSHYDCRRRIRVDVQA